MDAVILLLVVAVVWRILCVRYQKKHIALLGKHLASFHLEKHLETLTQGYVRAISSDTESRQLQILDSFAQTEHAVASQIQSLSHNIQQENAINTSMGILSFCVPYIELIAPSLCRDFRQLLQIHAQGIQFVVDNSPNWSPKERAFHLSAEIYLFQNSCHWFCKSRTIANARLQVQHKVSFQKTVESVSDKTRAAYEQWLQTKSQ